MNFYKELNPNNKFKSIFQEDRYKEIPNDSYIIITDIVNSTNHIESGLYKEVNTIGAACIAKVKKYNIPYSFGGDGASFIVPPEIKDKVLEKLSEVKNSSIKRFGLELRIGCISIKEIRKLGSNIKIMKFEVSKNEYLAKFIGGGLNLADKLIKQEKKYQYKNISSEENDFDNLSCRWKPIKNTRGTILTLIIQADSFLDYKEVYNEIDQTLQFNKKYNPIKTKTMSYKNIKEMIQDEKKYNQKKSLKYLFRILEIVMCYLLFFKLRKFLPKSLKKYIKSMERYSDYRKLDDTLRMVIDCSLLEVKKITEILDQFENIKYGMHLSESALMTCLVSNLNDGGHIHFVDGNNGGYALAAKNLKKKLENNKKVA